MGQQGEDKANMLPSSAAILRANLEAALAQRIPSAFTPAPKSIHAFADTGIRMVDEALEGGLPVGAITEIVGSECSGHTSLALSFLARRTQAGKICGWVDVSDALHPESAAAAGVDLDRMLWVRCGILAANGAAAVHSRFALPPQYLAPPTITKGLHGGGFGPHPRGEAKGLSEAVSGLLRPKDPTPAAPQELLDRRSAVSSHESSRESPPKPIAPLLPQPLQERLTDSTGQLRASNHPTRHTPWTRIGQKIDQALRVTDLLLQAGGFSAIVLDMGSIAPEFVSHVPLATWFRYRAAAERSQTSVLLLTQSACAKSSAGLVLRLKPASEIQPEATVFTGVEYCVEIERRRSTPAAGSVVSLRKPPQRATSWKSQTPWTARR